MPPMRGDQEAVNAVRRRPPSSGVRAVGDRAVVDRGDTDGVLVVCQLIDDAVGADAQRAQAAESTAQRVPRVRLALE